MVGDGDLEDPPQERTADGISLKVLASIMSCRFISIGSALKLGREFMAMKLSKS